MKIFMVYIYVLDTTAVSYNLDNWMSNGQLATAGSNPTVSGMRGGWTKTISTQLQVPLRDKSAAKKTPITILCNSKDDLQVLHEHKAADPLH